jgi:hypothetical protein
MNTAYPNLIYTSADHATIKSDDHEYTLLECNKSKIIYEKFAGFDRINDDDNTFGLRLFDKFRAPELTSVQPITFEQATDVTAMQLAALMEKSDLPIAVHWSGGIDSTLVLAGMIKNFNLALRNQVVVVMNNASYFENPYFFEQVIKPNFRYTSDYPYTWDNAIIINGDPADKLWIHANIIEIELEYKNVFDRSMTNPGILIEWMTKRSSKEFAHWLLEYVQQSARKAQIVLENYSDFFWWINFALFYQGCAFTSFCRSYNGSSTHWKNYNKNFFVWFNTDIYQQWSVYAQRTQEKFTGSITSYKMPAKDYIFDVDKNNWYKTYKTKSGSGKFQKTLILPVTSIYSDGTVSHAPSLYSELNLKQF